MSAFNIPAGWRDPRSAWVDEIVRNVAELGDRTSPDDWPDAMLVTAEELTLILEAALATPPVDAVPGEPVAQCKAGGKCRWRGHASASLVTEHAAASVASRAGSEPVAESASAWKSRLITEACSKWSGAQKVEAGEIIEWLADFRIQAAPIAPAAEPSEHLIIALDMLDYLSGYPDFTAPEGELIGTAITDAIAGRLPKLLSDVGSLSQGLRPSTPDRERALTTTPPVGECSGHPEECEADPKVGCVRWKLAP